MVIGFVLVQGIESLVYYVRAVFHKGNGLCKYMYIVVHACKLDRSTLTLHICILIILQVKTHFVYDWSMRVSVIHRGEIY